MQEQEARGQTWRGRSSVRTLRAGTRVQVLGAPLQQLGESASFTVLRVLSIGVNNMPPATQNALAELFGPVPELLEELRRADMPEDIELAIVQARETGYANCFSAVATNIIWHPPLARSDGAAYSKPVAFGAQSAIVVGADGNDQPSGADELYCDRLGRIRIRFHWQDGGNATCWVRVAQRSAGGGMGQQFLPRIGQEVLVQFLENDIDRPIVVGALYNGQGEGGSVSTPGGRRDKAVDLSCFETAHDHASSGQANLSGGNSPVWHGASADSAGHRNPTSQWGIRSKEFGGYGYSQLLFDDADGQGHVRFKSTHAVSELNLGQLIHAADNHRGSLRGIGAELRTDAYGAIRARAGLLITSFKINHNPTARDAAGENAAGVSLLTFAEKLAAPFNTVAITHQTVGLATHLGVIQADSCALDSKSALLKAVLTVTSGIVGTDSLSTARSDASAKNTNGGEGKMPHTTDPIAAITAQASFGAVAGQNVQLASGECVVLISGQEMLFASGRQMRVHNRQTIGFLAGTVKTGGNDVGLQMIVAKDEINVQAQADMLRVQARNEVNMVSANACVDWAGAKSISLSTAGGANINLDGGNITIQCPGKIAIHAGKKTFDGASNLEHRFPELPRGTMPFDDRFQLVDPAGDPVGNVRYAIIKEDGGRIEGVTDKAGIIPLQQGFSPETLRILILGKV